MLAFGTAALTLFDALVVAWGIGIGPVFELLVSAIPRLRYARR